MSELAIPIIFFLALIIFSSLWKLFQKAGTPGWYILIPIYGEWVLAGISGRPKWLGLPLALLHLRVRDAVGCRTPGAGRIHHIDLVNPLGANHV